MNAQHTPGPWEVRGPCEMTGRYSVTHNGPLFYVGDAGEPGDGEANARLAASAPELLEALLSIAEHAREFADLEDSETMVARMAEKARTAIAKATGKAA